MEEVLGAYCGVGGGNFPQPGDPDLNSPILSVSGAIGGLYISWTWPTINPHAVSHVKLYRGTTDEVALSTFRGIQHGDRYFDQSDVVSNTTYYYWIRFVSINGTEGDVIGPASGMMKPSVAEILEILRGQIGVEELYPDLRFDIENIHVNTLHLNQEIVDRQHADTLNINALGLAQGEIDGIGTLLNTEIIDRVDGDTALASQVSTILVQSDDNAAAIYTEQTARVDGDEALANALVALEASLLGDEEGQPGLLANAQAIAALQVRATADEELINTNSTDIVQLGNDVEANDGELVIASNAISQLDTEITVVDGKADANSVDITDLTASLVNTDSGVAGNALALQNLTTQVVTNEIGIAAHSTEITELNNEIGANDGQIAAHGIAIEQLNTNQSITDGNVSSNADSITALASSVDDVEQEITVNAAAIEGLDTRVSINDDSIEAQALSITALNSSIGLDPDNPDATATVIQAMQTDIVANEGEIEKAVAEYYVKTDVNGHVGGFGLYNNGEVSDFIVSVDNFAVVEGGTTNLTDGNPKIPFAIGYINGEATIAMDAAVFIADGTIETAAIGQAVINSAHIQDLAVENGKIGNYIQSNTINLPDIPGYGYNPSANTVGWRLDKQSGIKATEITIYDSAGGIILNSGGVSWSSINGNGRPQDFATAGATWGWDVTGQPSDQLLLNEHTTADDVGLGNVTDGADITSPTLGIKINHSSFNNPDSAEIYVHGYSDGNAADVDGHLWLSNQRLSIARGSVLTMGQTGYLAYQTNGPFSHGGTQTQIAIVRKEGSQWYSHTNSGWALYTPNSGAYIIGSVNGSGSDSGSGAGASLSAGAIWSTGTNITQFGGFSTLDEITQANVGTYIENLAVDSLQLAGNAVSVSGFASSASPSATLVMPSDSTLGISQNFIFHCNTTVNDDNNNPATYDLKITTMINGAAAQEHKYWFNSYGPDSWTVTRSPSGNNQSISCTVECLVHGTNTPVNSAWCQVTGHGGKR